MKALGIVRKIDHLGRMVIPKEVRRIHGWESGTPMEMYMDGNKLVLAPYGVDRAKEQVMENLSAALHHTDDHQLQSAIRETIEYLRKK